MSEVTTHGHNPAPFDYEERDIPARLLGLWAIGLFVGLGAVMAFVYFMYGTPRPRPVPELVLKRPMNQPALQPSPPADMQAFLIQQNEELSTYGWVDRAAGIVRLPIQVAIDRVLEKGLPVRGGSAK